MGRINLSWRALFALLVTVAVLAGLLAVAAPVAAATVRAPSVSRVSPASGSTLGGTVVTLTGANFSGASAVKFGDVAGSGVTVVSDKSLRVTSPAHVAGAVDVRVTTPSGTSVAVSAGRFTFSAPPAPAISGIDPASGPAAGGTVVTINGTNLAGATSVKFGDRDARFSVQSDGSITATSPMAATSNIAISSLPPAPMRNALEALTVTGRFFTAPKNLVLRPSARRFSPVTDTLPAIGRLPGGMVISAVM